jgi:protein-S-isoprenylcysteine O-methyltransferase Ste14
MTRTAAILGSALFLILAPGTVAGLVPWWITRWPQATPALPLAVVGGSLVVSGLLLLIECFGRFAVLGRGTPAPVALPERLVVTGAYRRVRNPMYVAVVAIVLGQAALFASPALLVYGLALWGGFHAFVLVHEEPTLRRAFPRDCAPFFAAVPRWIPRVRRWRG